MKRIQLKDLKVKKFRTSINGDVYRLGEYDARWDHYFAAVIGIPDAYTHFKPTQLVYPVSRRT